MMRVAETGATFHFWFVLISGEVIWHEDMKNSSDTIQETGRSTTKAIVMACRRKHASILTNCIYVECYEDKTG
ncbi:MAG: hypothetical protein D6698_03645 [Gammaproteobacteria bacterium]|nr:MAG: hypothetical protein D6698_03645 [Gammaproteobacteria bacterium]